MPQGGVLLERLVAVMTVAERRLERGWSGRGVG